jgi:hypothetical protein
MIKAAALYIVIIVAFLIAIICASLLSVAFYYRIEAQKAARVERLSNNLKSGIALLLSTTNSGADSLKIMDLYGRQEDSLLTSKSIWGTFDLNIMKAFASKDTLKQVFLSGSLFADSSSIYLADGDRPLLLGGTTLINGNVETPRAGIRAAYVEGRPYVSKKLIFGRIKESGRMLPKLNTGLIKQLISAFSKRGSKLPNLDSVENSFFNRPCIYEVNGNDCILKPRSIAGKVILIADSIVTIGSRTNLRDIQVYAPAIIVEAGFKGVCQLFAKDSIIIGKNCEFHYPSFAGVFKPDSGALQPKITLGDGSHFSGILFTYENKRSNLQTLISIGRNCLVQGQVYATGYLKLNRSADIHGKVYTTRFMMQTPTSLYENYLIDVSINRRLLSKYYLTSSLFKIKNEEQKILKWLK